MNIINVVLEEGEMKQIMVGDSYKSAVDFFKVRDEQFIPALTSGDSLTAEEILNTTLEKYYEAHRASIDKVVQLASAYNSKLETDTQLLIEKYTAYSRYSAHNNSCYFICIFFYNKCNQESHIQANRCSG